MTARVLVTGGAGYIGSHMLKALARAGLEPVTLDDLSAGHRDAVRYGELVAGDLADRALLDALFASRRFAGVIHFAGRIQVGESVRRPARYYRNNLGATLALLDAMVAHGVDALIFSSSAAVYGEPHRTPMDEAHPKEPVNPYGRSKWMVEQIVADYGRAYGLRATALRYFNAAGADPDGELGERHDPETHLIPLALGAAAGRRPPLTLHGSDYPTPDGTCIRDYVHVADLCDAHLLALRRLWDGGEGSACNLGNGAGFSVREVIAAAGRIAGRPVPVAEGPRRPGDPAELVADASRARSELGWHPRYPDLETIVGHAWEWQRRRR